MSIPVPEEIRAEMARQKIKASDLENLSGLNRMNIYRKIQREDRALTIDEAYKASEALGVPLSEIIRRAEATKKLAA